MPNVAWEGGTENLLTVQQWTAEQRKHVSVNTEWKEEIIMEIGSQRSSDEVSNYI